LHRRIYAIGAKSQQPPAPGTGSCLGSVVNLACRTYKGCAIVADRSATDGVATTSNRVPV
jgi:hypothetical protein